MVRLGFVRRPQSAKCMQSTIFQQKRQKTFIRRQNKKGEIYYTVNKRGVATPKPPEQHELFVVNDLLLDLEDWESKYSRPISEKDGKILHDKWSVSHKRTEVHASLSQMEDELNWSRRKVFETFSQTANSRRLGNHDILSVALKGTLPLNPQVGSLQARNQSTSASIPTELLVPSNELPPPIHTTYSENGIPKQVQEKDNLLLQWLKFRQQQYQIQHQAEVPTPSAKQLAESLEKQDSIAIVRRLLFRCLDSGLDATALSNTSLGNDDRHGRPIVNLASTLRDACTTILHKHKPKYEGILEALALLGNLNQRLAKEGGHLGSSLCGYAMTLSAEGCQLDVTTEYLDQGFSHQYWSGDQALEDILCTLESYSRHASKNSLDTHDRQTLFYLLTGAGEEAMAEESFRSIIVENLETAKNEKTTLLAADAYQAYIQLLGQLGAPMTLWSEWNNQSAMNVDELARNGKLPHQRGGSEANLAETFQSAVRMALSVMALGDDTANAPSSDIDLAGCAMIDYQSIAQQQADTRVGHQQEQARAARDLGRGGICADLDLPLDKWWEQVRHLPINVSQKRSGA